MASSVYRCQVMHQRLRPFTYRFQYAVLSLKIDIDRFEDEAKGLRFLSLNRFNLLQVNTADFGERSKTNWRSWANALLKHYGLPQPAARIELVCTPRILGMAFNPLAMWYAYDDADQLIGIIGEVSNTFGQWHHYVLTQNGNPLGDRLKTQADKTFHVSPFIGMNCDYRFRLSAPSSHFTLHIQQYEDNQPTLIATQSGDEQPLNNTTLLRAFVRFPFHAIKVLGLIHWWALKIWLKGGQFRTTPKSLTSIQHSHSEMVLCSK